jgi:hypothetical protein
MSEIVLPVSIGESLDKLTILDIKVEKINDIRKDDCLKEYTILYDLLKNYVIQYNYYYRILKEINLNIWNLQEHIHNDKNLTNTYGKILNENDRRYRVKKKINEVANSSLKEQKGYAKKKAFIYTHLGLGDHFWMNGSIRYLSTCYDEIVVVCKKNNEAVVQSMYSDDSSIKLFVINDDIELHPFVTRKYYFEDLGYDVYSCGYHTERPFIYEFPNSFYDDMKISRTIRTQYFFVSTTKESVELLEKVQNVSKEYILLHENSSQKMVNIFSNLNTTLPILDINKNNYAEDHKFYEVASLVVNQPMLSYKNLIEYAKEIHCLESSFYCFASHLDLSKVEKKICYEPYDNSAERIGIFSTGILV